MRLWGEILGASLIMGVVGCADKKVSVPPPENTEVVRLAEQSDICAGVPVKKRSGRSAQEYGWLTAMILPTLF